MTRRVLVGLALALLLAIGGLAGQGKARRVEAHALLVRADPPANAQVREPPTELRLYFTEPLERKFSRARVVNQDGARVDDAIEFDAADDALMIVKLKPIEPGFVSVFWENVSTVDGHRISGSYPLTILNSDGSVPAGKPVDAATQVSGAGARPERVVTKGILLVAGSLLTGAFAFLIFVTPNLPGAGGGTTTSVFGGRAVLLAMAALVLLLVVGAIEILLQASELGSDVTTVLETQWGERWLIRNVALVLPLLAVGLSLAGPGARRALAGVGLAGALLYLAATSSVSHAAAGEGATWAAAFDFVHLVTASVWTGMLALVVLLFIWAPKGLPAEDRYPVLAAALRRFSNVALISVALLLFTGTVNAVIELARFSDLLNDSYGQALLIKLLLLVPLLGVGAVNAYVLRPELEEAAEAGSRNWGSVLADLETSLGRLVRWEVALAVSVLLITGLLTQTTPTRGSVAPAQTGKFIDTNESSEVGVTLVVDPNQPGSNTFEVYLTGAVETVERVRLDFTQEGSTEGESRLILDLSKAPIFYVGQGPYLAQPGKWNVVVDLRRTRGSDLRIPFKVSVADPSGAAAPSGGGGSFASPVTWTAVTAGLIAVSAAASIVLVAGSWRRPGMPAGILGEAFASVAERVSIRGVRPVWSLAALILIGIGVGAILGSHIDKPISREIAQRENPIKSSPESIARGQMLFSANCSQCHGETGRGDGPLAKSLPIPPANLYDHVPYHPDQFFFGVITNGLSGNMPSFKASISEQDRWHILNFLRQQFGQPPAAQ